MKPNVLLISYLFEELTLSIKTGFACTLKVLEIPLSFIFLKMVVGAGKTLNFNPNFNSLSRTPKRKEQTHEDLGDKITHVVEELKKT